MITSAQLKIFLNIASSETAKDTLLSQCIDEACGIAEQQTNQKLLYNTYTVHLTGNGTDTIYLPARYIYLITAIKVYNRLGAYAWDDIFDSGYALYDGVAPSTDVGIVLEESSGLVSTRYQLTIKQGYVFTKGCKIQITFKGGYVSGDAWVTGTAYLVDDYTRYNDRTYKCLVAHTAGTFSTDLAANKWILATETLAPQDLQNAVIQEAAQIYQKSLGGGKQFGLSNENIGGQSSEGKTYKEIDTNAIYSRHRVINV